MKLTFEARIKIKLYVDEDLKPSDIHTFKPYTNDADSSNEEYDEDEEREIYCFEYSTLSQPNQLVICKHITDYLKDLQIAGRKEPNERGQIIGSHFIVDQQTGNVKFETIIDRVMTYDQVQHQLDVEFGDGYWSVGDDSVKLGGILMLPNCRIETSVRLIHESIHIN